MEDGFKEAVVRNGGGFTSEQEKCGRGRKSWRSWLGLRGVCTCWELDGLLIPLPWAGPEQGLGAGTASRALPNPSCWQTRPASGCPSHLRL